MRNIPNALSNDVVENPAGIGEVLQMGMVNVDQPPGVTHPGQDGCGQIAERLPEVGDRSAVFRSRVVEGTARYDEDVGWPNACVPQKPVNKKTPVIAANVNLPIDCPLLRQ